MDEIENQLMNLEVQKVSLVGVPAIGRRWAIRKDAGGDTETMNGGMSMAEETNVVEQEAQPDIAAIEKQLADKDANIEILKGELEAVKKAMRLKELEPICTNLGIDAEMVFKAEAADVEVSKYFMGKLEEADARITELMKELGTAGEALEPDELEGKALKIAKEKGISMAEAILQASAENPHLAREHMRKGA